MYCYENFRMQIIKLAKKPKKFMKRIIFSPDMFLLWDTRSRCICSQNMERLVYDNHIIEQYMMNVQVHVRLLQSI
jgi:hypothetical protein